MKILQEKNNATSNNQFASVFKNETLCKENKSTEETIQTIIAKEKAKIEEFSILLKCQKNIH